MLITKRYCISCKLEKAPMCNTIIEVHTYVLYETMCTALYSPITDSFCDNHQLLVKVILVFIVLFSII